jgi:energy-coupling factor transporter ATP-binding protein EcfA2
MHNLTDIRKDEIKLREMNIYLNCLIIFCFVLTAYSYIIAFTPKYLLKPEVRVKWLSVGLVSSLISGALSSTKLPKIENRIEEIELDASIYEENNRRLLLSFSNQQLEHNLTNQVFPQQEGKDPFIESMMTQIMNAPLKESNQEIIQHKKDENTIIETENNIFYNWNECIDEAVGFIISGNSGSGKTSVACWLAGLLTSEKPAQVIALDPHYNDTWEQVGIKSLGKIHEIESTLIWLLMELDNRCDRKSKKLTLGDDLIIFCDEVNACLERFEDKKTVESAIKRLGSEGRKFGITFIILNQSHNAGDLGISLKYLNNYFMIALGASARAIINENFKQGTMEKNYISTVAYPCVVSGSIPINLALHPTHSSYQKFKKHGNPPLNLLPIKQLPLQIGIEKHQYQHPHTPTSTYNYHTVDTVRDVGDQQHQQIIQNLDNLYDVDYNPLPDNCPHCESLNIISWGSGRKKCNNCNKTFKV